MTPLAFASRSQLSLAVVALATLISACDVPPEELSAEGLPDSDSVAAESQDTNLQALLAGLNAASGVADAADDIETRSQPLFTAAPLPSGPRQYRVQITGRTFFGNTIWGTNPTRWDPAESFNLPGVLVLTPTVDRLNASRNGINAREIGIFVGSPFPNPRAGSMWFATNMDLFRFVGGSPTITRSALDLAFVTADQNRGTIQIGLDQKVARSAQLAAFNVRSGLLAAAYTPLLSDVKISFGNGGRSLQGTVTLFGTGFIDPSTVAVTAQIVGEAIN